ncbi:HET-domain-containing protein [Ophiobolus disseminans]|uniref:HET-domain-containing protein n=1 Tax=Ophiobolus disseminans TaxID=1469910 RepID=A0A6A7AED4_9PLEO|nr:HET-domain-containing protein [Ophiobolus disseminans]
MRLLHAATRKFHEFDGVFIPAYAILSHGWEGDEVTYQELRDDAPAAAHKAGFKKIHQCCQQALRDGLSFVWVDTCCIDKSSSAELSEAIKSMYQWYQRSTACYAYLSDVQLWDTYKVEDVDGRKWWTRGWTLQELIAPASVVFYAEGVRRSDPHCMAIRVRKAQR